jgi:hypothetical protein
LFPYVFRAEGAPIALALLLCGFEIACVGGTVCKLRGFLSSYF